MLATAKTVHYTTNKTCSTDLQVSDRLAESFPLQHVPPGFLEHELTARYGISSDRQTLLGRKLR